MRRMSNQESSDLEEMELPRRTWLTRPLSLTVLKMMSTFESNREYFDTPISDDDSDAEEKDKVRIYFHYAFYDRSRWYAVPFIGVVIALTLDTCGILMTGLPLQAYGLALDAVGALIIASGLFRGVNGILIDTPEQKVGMINGGYSWFEPGPLSSTVRSTVDGIYGAVFLFLGFTLQFLAVANIILIHC